MERALYVLLALLLNAVAFDARGPYGWLKLDRVARIPAKLIRGIERRLNRRQRDAATRKRRGVLLLVSVLMAAWGLAALLAFAGHAGEFIALTLLLPVRPVWDKARAIKRALAAEETAKARLMLRGSVWRHYALLDAPALARAAIEILAVGFAEKILAPCFWYLLLGLPGLFLAKAIYLLEEQLCQPEPADNAFGAWARTLHYGVAYLPSRIASLLWLTAMMFLQGCRPIVALRQIASGIVTRTPEAVDVAAAASALNLSLGGPTSVYTRGKWLGSGSAKALPDDIGRAMYLYVLVHGLLVLGVGLLV